MPFGKKKSKKNKAKKAKRARSMTRAQFYNVLAERLEEQEFTKKDVKALFEEAYDFIMEKLPQVGKVPLGNLGTLTLKDRPARMARNPMTGEKVHVPAKKVVKFRVASSIRKTFAPPKKRKKVA